MQHAKRILKVYQRVIFLGVVTVFAVIAIITGIVPLAKKVIGLADQVSIMQGDVQALTQKSAVLQGLDEAALRNELVSLSQAIPPDKSLPTVLSTLDGVAGQTGVTIVSFELQKPGSLATQSAAKLTAEETKLSAHILPFTVSVSGTYNQIRSFLSTIGSVRRYFRVNTLDVNVSGAVTTARLAINAFYVPYPTAVGAVNQPISPLSAAEQDTITKISNLPLLVQEGFAVGSASASPSGSRVDPFSF